MTDEEMTRQEKAAETKRARTQAKLIHAVDFAVQENGLDTTVEQIAEEAGISTATFYTFYGSTPNDSARRSPRNQLAIDAVTELVVEPLGPYAEALALIGTGRKDRREAASNYIDRFIELTKDRADLLRLALIGRLDLDRPNPSASVVVTRTPGHKHEEEARIVGGDFVDHLAAQILRVVEGPNPLKEPDSDKHEPESRAWVPTQTEAEIEADRLRRDREYHASIMMLRGTALMLMHERAYKEDVKGVFSMVVEEWT